MPRIAAVTVYITDLEKGITFYTTQLGFSVKARYGPELVELEHEGVALLLAVAGQPRRVNYPTEAATVIGIAASRLEDQLERLRKQKVELVVDTPTQFPGGRFIAVRDPAGNVIELLEFAA